ERGGGARGTAGGGPARRRAVVARRIGAVERARLRRAGQAVARAAHAGAAPAHARGAAGADGAGADRFDAAGQVDLRVEREGQAIEGARAARDAAGTDARPVRDDIEDTGTGGGVGRVRDGEWRAEEAAGTRAVAHPVGWGARGRAAAGGDVGGERGTEDGVGRRAPRARRDLAEGEAAVGDRGGEVDPGGLAAAEVEAGAVEMPAAFLAAGAGALRVRRAGRPVVRSLHALRRAHVARRVRPAAGRRGREREQRGQLTAAVTLRVSRPRREGDNPQPSRRHENDTEKGAGSDCEEPPDGQPPNESSHANLLSIE